AALELLGCHVVERSEEGSGACEAGVDAARLREPEVRQVGMLATIVAGSCGDQDVGRLHIAMDETPAVGGIQGAGHLAEQMHGQIWLQRPALESLLEVGALDI